PKAHRAIGRSLGWKPAVSSRWKAARFPCPTVQFERRAFSSAGADPTIAHFSRTDRKLDGVLRRHAFTNYTVHSEFCSNAAERRKHFPSCGVAHQRVGIFVFTLVPLARLMSRVRHARSLLSQTFPKRSF